MRSVTRSYVLVSLGVLAILGTGVDGCDKAQDIQNWFDNTAKLKLTAKKQGDVTPYRQEQFEALKTYFSEINQMALSLKNDANLRDRFGGAVAQTDLNVVCGKVFLARTDWQVMMQRCTRNNFFLCAEEVRSYPETVAAMRAALAVEQQKRFDGAQDCSSLPKAGTKSMK